MCRSSRLGIQHSFAFCLKCDAESKRMELCKGAKHPLFLCLLTRPCSEIFLIDMLMEIFGINIVSAH